MVAVSLNAGDYHSVTGRPYIIRTVMGFAEFPGMDFSGVVEEIGVGTNAGDFTVGSRREPRVN